MPAYSKKVKIAVEYKGFVQVQLGEADITLLSSEVLNSEDLITMLTSICAERYKLAITINDDDDGYRATLQDVSDDRTSRGWMLSAEGPTVPLCIAVLSYKHTVLMGGDWVPFCNTSRKAKGLR